MAIPNSMIERLWHSIQLSHLLILTRGYKFLKALKIRNFHELDQLDNILGVKGQIYLEVVHNYRYRVLQAVLIAHHPKRHENEEKSENKLANKTRKLSNNSNRCFRKR